MLNRCGECIDSIVCFHDTIDKPNWHEERLEVVGDDSHRVRSSVSAWILWYRFKTLSRFKRLSWRLPPTRSLQHVFHLTCRKALFHHVPWFRGLLGDTESLHLRSQPLALSCVVYKLQISQKRKTVQMYRTSESVAKRLSEASGCLLICSRTSKYSSVVRREAGLNPSSRSPTFWSSTSQ